MWFGYLTLAVAFFLSVVAAYYSVLGLVAIFSAAAIPVIIMGGALETGKVVAAMWLHRNWHRAPWTYKAYLLPSLLALMLLTSMGTFGYLSKAHSDQSLVSGDVTSKIALYDEKIKIARENIDANRRSLKQMDEAVDQTMGRSTSESGADKAVQVRRSQARERTRLLQDIEAEQKKITELNEARAPIAAEVRKVEAEVGPIKYIAALLYGDNPENNLLEAAVRWVIILIVIVFDPLAIVLILAGTRHLEWEKLLKKQNIILPAVQFNQPVDEPKIEKKVEPAYLKPGTWFKWRPFPKQTFPADLNKPFVSIFNQQLPPVVHTSNTDQTQESPKSNIESTSKTLSDDEITRLKNSFLDTEFVPPFEVLNDSLVRIQGKVFNIDSLAQNGYANVSRALKNKNFIETKNDVSFGKTFPLRPFKGQMHVHLGTLPSKLFKYNGISWIEVDKTVSDSYTHNQAYIKYLVEKIESKEITLDDLTQQEQDMIFEHLKNA